MGSFSKPVGPGFWIFNKVYYSSKRRNHQSIRSGIAWKLKKREHSQNEQITAGGLLDFRKQSNKNKNKPNRKQRFSTTEQNRN